VSELSFEKIRIPLFFFTNGHQPCHYLTRLEWSSIILLCLTSYLSISLHCETLYLSLSSTSTPLQLSLHPR